MTPFEYIRPGSIETALNALTTSARAELLAGGTCLIDLMKQGVQTPATVVDLNFISELNGVDILPSGNLRIGAMTTLSHVARKPVVQSQWPFLHEAIVEGLTPQLRNAATFGGNIMQRPRCIYFREPGFDCNKKRPGSGCAAQTGVHYAHAIFGGSDAKSCIAVSPSDLSVALTALEAKVHISGTGENRVLPILDLHRLPGDHPECETSLASKDLITAIEVPPQGRFGGAYVKGTEGFALASCAALLELQGDTIKSVRIVLGGVAHKPWRAHAAETVLIGRAPAADLFWQAAAAATDDASTDFQTAFRLPLLRAVIEEALRKASERGRGS